MVIKDVKIVVMGSGGVGKSALTVRFVHDFWVERYDPTIEDSYRKMVSLNGTRYQCEILDTAGTEQFMSLHSLYMRSGDCFLLVFSLTSIESLQELPHIREQIARAKEGDGLQVTEIPIVLVGNKCDLEEECQVTKHQAQSLANSWNNTPYYETSARKDINVTTVFEKVLEFYARVHAMNGQLMTPTKRRKERRCTIL